MSLRSDDDARLTSLLQALPVPEPSAELLAGTRRRYREAIEARDRRHVLTGLVAALVGLTVTATLLGSAVEPAALAGWLAETAADLVRWTTGVGVVAALVPLPVWTSAVLASAAATLSLILVVRGQSQSLMK
jgi:hypothetical protein